MKLLLSIFVFSSSLALAQTGAKQNPAVPKKLPEKNPVPPVATPVPSQNQPKVISVDPSNSLRISYGYPAWNKQPLQLDSGSLIMRERATGQLVQIHLIETEPDSSTFAGLYSIRWENAEKMQVDFFVPPQNLLDSTEGMKKIAEMIAKQQLLRKPFIFRRSHTTGAQSIEIFDTPEQARTAMRAYLAERQIQGLQNKKYPSDQEVDTAKLAAELKMKAEAAKTAAERVRLEQIEARKLAAMKAREAEINAQEKARRKKEGEELAKEGLALYQDGKFAEATEKFNRAIELDPENHSYYFQYGVALYKTDGFNRSLVYLNLAKGPEVNEVEKNFFIGLNHFRMKEYDLAVAAFDQVVKNGHPEMAPSAQFYKGMARFEEKNWDEARNAFQAVLDTSKDPQLDQRAENYIEQILRIRQFEEEKARKWQISATIGTQYDSNVTLISESSLSQGAATNAEGYRSLLMGSARYRPTYTETKEWALQLDTLYMYTLDNTFAYNQKLRNADPFVLTLTAPWTHKGLLWGKGYKLDIIPGYESIAMSVEANTQKEIISAFFLNFANMFVMSNSLFSNFNLELRNDMNKMNSMTGDDDSSAIKTKLVNSNLHFMSDDKTKIMTTEFAYTNNSAVGKNSVYNRFDVAAGWIQPFYWNTNAIAKLGYFHLNYPMKSDGRTDNSYTLTLGASKKLNDLLNLGLTGSYNDNMSNTSAYTYKKWTTMLTLSALHAF